MHVYRENGSAAILQGGLISVCISRPWQTALLFAWRFQPLKSKKTLSNDRMIIIISELILEDSCGLNVPRS